MHVTTYNVLIGLTFKSVEKIGEDELRFTSECGRVFKFCHWQECCESVYIEDIVGDLSDLEGAPLLVAEEVVSDSEEIAFSTETWTFYKFATKKGYVDVRWYGESNGYYSESVDFEEVTENK